MPEDHELLRDYAQHRSESAFTELVQRHVDLVYSAALRETRGDSATAEDITQAVFSELAGKASTLCSHPALAGWLYTCVRLMSANARRSNDRRQRREQEAHTMNELLTSDSAESSWRQVEPVLDDAMHELSETDRAAVVLRFFEDRSHKEVGLALGLSESAARKRVDRALETLRGLLAKRGVSVGASGLVLVISANAVHAAPVGLAVTISTAATALAGTTIATTATAAITKAILMTTLQKTVVGATLAVAVGAGIYEARQASILRSEVQTLQQQRAPLAEQIEQLSRERDEATQRLVALRSDNERLNRNTIELVRLRGEFARLGNAAETARQSEMDTIQAQWAAWVTVMRTNVVSPEDAVYLVQALTNETTRTRLEATWALRNIGLQRLYDTNLSSQADLELQQATRIAVPALVEALKDPDSFVRANAALTLGFLRERLDELVPALAAALNDQENRVALSAAKALSRLQSLATNAVPALLRSARSSDDARHEAAINALKQIEPESVRKAELD